MCTRLTSNVWGAMGRAWGQGTARVAARDERANLVLPRVKAMSAGAPVYSSSDTTRAQHAFHLRALRLYGQQSATRGQASRLSLWIHTRDTAGCGHIGNSC